MKQLHKDKLPLKYLINFTIIKPNIIDLLFEIVNFLDKEKRYDGEINYWEICNKTVTRISDNVDDDIQLLIDNGFLEKGKYTKYKVINHPWK